MTSKGRVTIPAKVRRVVLVKAEGRPTESRFAAVRGCADAGLTTDAIMALMRGERWRSSTPM